MADRTAHVVGAGGHAKVLVATLIAAGYEVEALYDDAKARWGTSVLGRPVLGPKSMLDGRDVPVVLGIGDNAARARIAKERDRQWITAVHPSAIVHPSVVIGAGT